jgi:hypothetical protein
MHCRERSGSAALMQQGRAAGQGGKRAHLIWLSLKVWFTCNTSTSSGRQSDHAQPYLPRGGATPSCTTPLRHAGAIPLQRLGRAGTCSRQGHCVTPTLPHNSTHTHPMRAAVLSAAPACVCTCTYREGVGGPVWPLPLQGEGLAGRKGGQALDGDLVKGTNLHRDRSQQHQAGASIPTPPWSEGRGQGGRRRQAALAEQGPTLS